MVETAAHLIDELLPRVPFRQFVISFPMRIRHYLENHITLQAVLKIVVDEIRKTLIANNLNVQDPQIGAISFLQHFGNTLNYHRLRDAAALPIGIVHGAAIPIFI